MASTVATAPMLNASSSLPVSCSMRLAMGQVAQLISALAMYLGMYNAVLHELFATKSSAGKPAMKGLHAQTCCSSLLPYRGEGMQGVLDG